MSITSDRIWAYRPNSGGHLELVGALRSGPTSCAIIDLSADAEPEWWSGRVACLGSCREHVFVGMVNLPDSEVPHNLMCPQCKNENACPDIYWGDAYRISCMCGRTRLLLQVTRDLDRNDRMCKRCGSYTTRAERWPFPS